MISKLLDRLPPSIAAVLARYVPTQKVLAGFLASGAAFVLAALHVYHLDPVLQGLLNTGTFAAAAWLAPEDPDHPAIQRAALKDERKRGEA